MNPYKVVGGYINALHPEIKDATKEQKQKLPLFWKAKAALDNKTVCQCFLITSFSLFSCVFNI